MLVTWLVQGLACATDIDGVVVGVADGDTLTVLSGGGQFKVRMVEIDAPEKAQPYGQRARTSLADLCFRRPVHVVDKGQDRYGRTLGRVWCAGVDANKEQVRRGMAWVYERYVTDRGLYKVQGQAQGRHLGLWADPSPIPPWDWRNGSR
ncbi:thermonuclease family protein [Rubrivivax sp. A210]|uniref:thermonuclease family protein n=1 Tax=Rubrivivax sp. A210 TaxID=2772301 RepID=UPI0039883925